MRNTLVLMAALACWSGAALGQTAAERTAAGDREVAARNLTAALADYRDALALDSMNVAALTKAAHTAVDLGEFDPATDERAALYRSAEQYARRAAAANPNDANAHFVLAMALGRNALTMGTRDKIRMAGEVRREALAALQLDPAHGGALHVMGVWNAEIMRLSGLSRVFAKTFLGAQIFNEASWDNAQRYMEQAVAAEPNRITHHLDLGRVYADRGMKDKAAEQFQWVVNAPVTEYNDPHYKADAAKRLEALR